MNQLKATQLRLRVNGRDIDSIKVRRKLISGAPIGDQELVIEDTQLGAFSVDESFILEVALPRSKHWKIISVKNFLAMLDSIEAS